MPAPPHLAPGPHDADRLTDAATVGNAMPRLASGPAVDPITLAPVDELAITIMVDNSYDALLPDTGPTRRADPGLLARTPASQFEGGHTLGALRAEHGFSALVTVRRGATAHTLLMDTGLSPDALVVNADLLGIDLTAVEAVVLSHGHYDHTGGLAGLARLHRGFALPLVLHPECWLRRRIAVPGRAPRDLPTLSRAAVEAEGFTLVERRHPSVLLDGQVLITAEIDRTTEYERGMPFHQAYLDGAWAPDPRLIDDQALVVHVRGRGLVVLTGCGHAGAVNTVRHALRLTGIDRLCALIGGLHLSGRAFEPVIAPTIDALTRLAPEVIMPAHCTGWTAQHRLTAAFPTALVPSAVGTRLTLTGA